MFKNVFTNDEFLLKTTLLGVRTSSDINCSDFESLKGGPGVSRYLNSDKSYQNSDIETPVYHHTIKRVQVKLLNRLSVTH